MNPQPGTSWPTPAASVSGQSNNEHNVPDQQRPLGSFGGPLPPQQARPQMNGPPLVSQPGTFYPGQTNGHPLGQGSPMQQNRVAFQQQHSPPSNQHQNAAPAYSLPALNPAVQQVQQPQVVHEIEREQREREAELERRQQQEAIAQRDYEREIELREQQQREQLPSPLENHTGSIPIQQPVASRIPATLHGPNGILNHQHVGTNGVQTAPSAPLGAPTGPGNVFANNMPNARETSPRPFIQQGPQMIPAQQLLNPGGLEAAQQLTAPLSQGAQQPILNDALSYLDQVKVRFVDHPDVYNRFLDIMKDFKSQAIDTPGVIDRVSSLFAGHPELIQGFNTFLPPGYRIECGTQDDPNAIRVTTPMGTTVSQMPSAPNRFTMGPGSVQGLENGLSAIRQGPYADSQVNGEWPSHRIDGVESTESLFGNGRADMPSQYDGQSTATQDGTLAYERQEQLAAAEAAHRQEQLGVSNLSHVASAIATNGSASQLPLAQASPTGGHAMALNHSGLAMSGQGSVLTPGNQMGLEKRGPVEFNHAIGYVNKIKTRFQHQPDIYKSFLEILQTYQRESKPIQDVYAQVTQLFNAAPDLLEDFKQFLPESAAQAKAQAAARQATEDAAMLSNVRGDASYLTSAAQRQAHTPRPEMKMPPVGNFAPPPSVGKENKKRRGGAGSQMTGGAAAVDTGLGASSQIKGSGMRGGSSSKPPKKRARIEAKQPGPEVPPVSPTLVPSLPRPMPPTDTSASSADEFAFFDRVRKHVSNKSTYNEFLKITNLFTQGMIDKNLLVHKCFSFLGNNIELYNWFKDYIKYDGRDEIVDNMPRTASTKVVLSNCRGLGPSYRLVPKAAKLEMKCSGRDEMCHSVLNDDWSSFPTWASEDSGFIAHRKNTFEDALHRCEEERHDYDINIEACLRTIQLMEPIVAQISGLQRAEQEVYKLPRGIGGMSETIYERVIKKIYGREVGGRVIQDMFDLPAAVLPMLVWRLNQKVEEWKASMREWDKVWREQVHRQFWKSLDHQGDRIKQADRRPFQPKALQSEIQIKYEEQRRARLISSAIVPRYQLKYAFQDVDVIFDTCHLLLTTSYTASTGVAEYSKMENFFNTFLSAFFDLDTEAFERKMSDIYDNSPPNEEVDDEHIEEPGPSRGRRITNGRKGTLLRGVLDRRLGQKERDGSAMRNSKETTPDIGSMDDGTVTPSDQSGRADPAEHRWMDHPHGVLNHDEPFRRDTFGLYASSNIYCFFRLFQMLYERLANIKACEDDVHNEVWRANVPKPADGLGIQDRKPSEYFGKTGPGANYYRQTLAMCESVARGDMEAATLEETLRRFYLQKGWQLYNFDKVTSATLRFATSILTSDNKDKSLDIINLFYKDRKEDETTHDAELMYRKQVEKLSKDGDIYRITYSRNAREAFIQIFKKDDRTFETDEMAAIDRWKYYVSSYTMRDQTEGVPADKTFLPYLRRNLPPVPDSVEEYNRLYKSPQHNQDGLTIRISQETYRVMFEKGSAEWFVHDDVLRRRGLSGMREVTEERARKFRERFVVGPEWIKGLGREEVEQAERWIKGGTREEEVSPQNEGAVDEAKMDQDEVMTGA